MSKIEALTMQFKKAISRLEDVLAQEKNEFIQDSAIQRFEFTFDLSWKALKTYLEEEKGVICNSPKECFKEAYKQGILEYDEFWLEIVDYRNQTSHTYNEAAAEEIYEILPKTLEYFKKLLEKIS